MLYRSIIMAGRKRGPPPGVVADDRLVKQSRMDEQDPDAEVTLKAEGQKFAVHRNKLAAVSDCFRAMFSNGMLETRQREIKLRGVSAKGLEKTLEVVNTGGTILKGRNISSLIAAATYLQVTPVIEYCERAIASRISTSNFFHFAATARYYGLSKTLRQIDAFIARNLKRIAKRGNLKHVTFDQMVACLTSENMLLPELEVFNITCEWLRQDPGMAHHALRLMSLIRFRLIRPSDLVHGVQKVDMMTSHPELLRMVLAAVNYYVVPHSQPLADVASVCPRVTVTRAVCVASFEVNGNDRTVVTAFDPCAVSNGQRSTRRRVVNLPEGLDGIELVNLNNFLYVLGGMNTLSFSNNVCRYDPRSHSWYLACPMLRGRYRFFAGAIHNKIYAVGGDCTVGVSVTNAERYDPATDKWDATASLCGSRSLHSGAVLDDYIYVSGGCMGAQSTSEVHRYDPETDTWESVASMLGPRGGHVMVAARGKLFVFGGHVLNTNNVTLNETRCETYNPVTDQWTVLAPLDVPHDGSSCLLHDRYVWVIGGQDVTDCTDQKLVSRYDLDSNTWEVLSNWPRSLRTFGSRCCTLKFPKVQNGPSFLPVSFPG